jgi:N-acetylglucosaminyldiphosphoundecaprenol N-acetyl-beta-D-mannosaminyltransferase
MDRELVVAAELSFAGRRRESVLNVPVDVLSWDDAVDLIFGWTTRRESKTVCTCNVHSLVTARRNGGHADALRSADLITPDGAPVAWLLRRLGNRLQERISGPDLMWTCCQKAAELGTEIFLCGGTPEVVRRLTERLRKQFPGINIVGAVSPPFRELTPTEDEELVNLINRSGARLVWVGLGCPKQESWLKAHRGRVLAVMVGVGAAFDFHAGIIKRAPAWVRRIGCEWLYRLSREPRRLMSRYLVTNTIFTIGVLQFFLTRGRVHVRAPLPAKHSAKSRSLPDHKTAPRNFAPPFLVTTSWDDGHPADLRVAELLERHGLKGTFFVPSQNVEGRPVMRPGEVAQLAQRFEIGGHTHSHTSLVGVPPGGAADEIGRNKFWLEDVLGQQVRGFAYVRGHYDRPLRDLVAQAGYAYARTIKNMMSVPGSNRFEVSTTAQFFPHRRSTYIKNYLHGVPTLQRSAVMAALLSGEGLSERLLKAAKICAESGGYFHLWGHSWEVDQLDLWDELDRFFRLLRQLPARFVNNDTWCEDLQRGELRKSPATEIVSAAVHPRQPRHVGDCPDG